ncbi:deuterosome assembly protein 1 isoform X3 [Ornithorhynchus anatinus]|uniref:deuterosome assembly protein 1 isoform X3 n=1 Tax=Ornithorhynchus anatinus TaxID=9258 RepID=UPI0019D4E1A0|nr:deuterosome assembly protein 1 isoform X3 [Ornithorhynchus anatinus]
MGQHVEMEKQDLTATESRIICVVVFKKTPPMVKFSECVSLWERKRERGQCRILRPAHLGQRKSPSPCPFELQELMEQIKIMVSNKKLDWDRKMQALEIDLNLRDQEIANAHNCLDKKNQEVGLLQQKLNHLEKHNYDMSQKYQGELHTLKSQFSKLTNSYEKLKLHQDKQDSALREKSLTEETPFGLGNLNRKLEEFKTKSEEWDKQETLYQHYLFSLDAQQKLLSEKCNLFQKQAQRYQTHLTGKKKCLEGASLSNLERFPDEPGASNATAEEDESVIDKLRSTVSEMALSRSKLHDESQKLHQELKIYQTQCKTMKTGLSEVKNDLESEDDVLRGVETERLKLHRESLKAGGYHNIHENQRLESSYTHPVKELEKKRNNLLFLAQDHVSQEKELNKMRNHLYHEEQSRSSEQKRMRAKISDLTEELHQKEITIATIMKQATLMERQFKMELEIKEKMLAKQENMNTCNMEQALYITTINKLENENRMLRKSLAKLQEDRQSEWTEPETHEDTVKHTNPNQIKMITNEDRPNPEDEPSRGRDSPSPHKMFPLQHSRLLPVKDVPNRESPSFRENEIFSQPKEYLRIKYAVCFPLESCKNPFPQERRKVSLSHRSNLRVKGFSATQ